MPEIRREKGPRGVKVVLASWRLSGEGDFVGYEGGVGAEVGGWSVRGNDGGSIGVGDVVGCVCWRWRKNVKGRFWVSMVLV